VRDGLSSETEVRWKHDMFEKREIVPITPKQKPDVSKQDALEFGSENGHTAAEANETGKQDDVEDESDLAVLEDQ